MGKKQIEELASDNDFIGFEDDDDAPIEISKASKKEFREISKK
jgi:hypothetical protein